VERRLRIDEKKTREVKYVTIRKVKEIRIRNIGRERMSENKINKQKIR
jgi:hypothetical protein